MRCVAARVGGVRRPKLRFDGFGVEGVARVRRIMWISDPKN